jgi:ribonuclease BN (tRNA processing enzyme)
MASHGFRAKIYGVRGSFPIAPPEGTRIGGNTTCMMARSDEHILIIDAGSGIVNLGKELVPEIMAHKQKSDDPFHITMIFTHTHIDHLLGFPYFAPLYIPGVHLTLIGPGTLGVDFEDILGTLVEPQYYPVAMDEFRSTKYFENISENMVLYFIKGEPMPLIADVGDPVPADVSFTVKTMKYYFHPKDGSYIFRLERGGNSLVFATDVEEYVGSDQRLVAFARDCDVLIHDAQYAAEDYSKFQGYGHSSVPMACDAAAQAHAGELLLFHHDPASDDEKLKEMEKEAKKLFKNAALAYEGWEWVVK